MRREGRRRDRGYEAAYQAGLEGLELDPDADDQTRQAHEAGQAERRRRRSDRIFEAGRNVPGIRGPAPISDGAGFVLGLLVYALVLNFLQGGAPQARGWLAAKFINKPYQQPAKGRGTAAR